jgi:peptide/nickel transport system permease protein
MATTTLETSRMRRPLALGLLRRVAGRSVSRWVGISLFGAIVLLCILVPILSPYSSTTIVAKAFQPPSLNHLFGTDSVGRDVFTRTFVGGRIDLVASLFTSIFAVAVGTALGTLSGSTRHRWFDAILMRLVDSLFAFPFIILLLSLVAVIGTSVAWGPAPPGLIPVMIGLMMVQWATYARLARGQALTFQNSDFVLAARVAGLPQRTIVMSHILPGVRRVTLAYWAGDILVVSLLLSGLPFLGAGVQAPAAEWGSIMYEGHGFIQQAPWITLFPGLILCLTGLGLTLIADSLLDREARA